MGRLDLRKGGEVVAIDVLPKKGTELLYNRYGRKLERGYKLVGINCKQDGIYDESLGLDGVTLLILVGKEKLGTKGVQNQ